MPRTSRRYSAKNRHKIKVPSSQVPADALPEALRHSVLPEPVDTSWQLLDDLFFEHRLKSKPAPTRKEAIEFLVHEGIAFYTARTQFQAWWTHTLRGKKLMRDGNPRT